MRTAFWLYLFSFIAIFDLHAQYPILTPFAVSLGAAPSFIGLMMGLYSITHLPGNVIAGWSVDRFGSRVFIVLSLLAAGIILLLQSRVEDPWHLLLLRSISGFVLAFLSPACMALLARISADRILQGKLMAGNGLVHTLASVVSPAAGALLVARLGFELSFFALGWLLIGTAVCALLFIRDIRPTAAAGGTAGPPHAGAPGAHGAAAHPAAALPAKAKEAGALLPGTPQPVAADDDLPLPWLVYVLPIAMSCAQGILSFELPLLAMHDHSIMQTGLLFSVLSLGSLVTLSMMFLNRYSSFRRTLAGALILALSYFTAAVGDLVPLTALLFIIGMAKGIIYPALTTLLIELTGSAKYGRTFSVLSIAYSVGAFLGPLTAGYVRDAISPYFIAFLVLMTGVALLPFAGPRRLHTASGRIG
ncbi:MAG: MFS transporter [Thermobacillus sp.]|uniref:Sugar phosphate permease n=1 Tax=Thermobacillus composti (strain DSM 18247 / JCM 13945 / KWC4) TaxID=717605 RepID=L0ED09_THECK|nr:MULTISPECIES: MFS transporter [Thermobacillus]AGA57045.1 sugar phosphate permease [Thermobacillus composti KWC4]REK56515.1 MAG: MFS transporter [Thermobacillus sp.]